MTYNQSEAFNWIDDDL